MFFSTVLFCKVYMKINKALVLILIIQVRYTSCRSYFLILIQDLVHSPYCLKPSLSLSTHTFCKLTLLILRKSFDIVVHECTKLELLNKNDLQKSLNPKIRCVGKLLDFKTGPDVIPKGG